MRLLTWAALFGAIYYIWKNEKSGTVYLHPWLKWATIGGLSLVVVFFGLLQLVGLLFVWSLPHTKV